MAVFRLRSPQFPLLMGDFKHGDFRTKNQIPQKYKVFSGSALKMIAVVTMLIDHVGHILLSQYPLAVDVWCEIGEEQISLYWIFRTIGRTAFPIYCFLLTEGYIHTHDRKKYGLNLLVFALISEIPWNLEHVGKIAYPDKQNVFFTLFLGYIGNLYL